MAIGPATCTARQRTAYSVTGTGPAFGTGNAVAAPGVFGACIVVEGGHQKRARGKVTCRAIVHETLSSRSNERPQQAVMYVVDSSK